MTTVYPPPIGPISGTEEQGIFVFKGIPFAEPPLDELLYVNI